MATGIGNGPTIRPFGNPQQHALVGTAVDVGTSMVALGVNLLLAGVCLRVGMKLIRVGLEILFPSAR